MQRPAQKQTRRHMFMRASARYGRTSPRQPLTFLTLQRQGSRGVRPRRNKCQPRFADRRRAQRRHTCLIIPQYLVRDAMVDTVQLSSATLLFSPGIYQYLPSMPPRTSAPSSGNRFGAWLRLIQNVETLGSKWPNECTGQANPSFIWNTLALAFTQSVPRTLFPFARHGKSNKTHQGLRPLRHHPRH